MSSIRRPFLTEPLAEKEPTRLGALLVYTGKMLLRLFFLLVCACLTALLFKESYPKPSHGLLAWVALAPFILAVVRLNTFWRSFGYSWLTGILVYAGVYHWIFITCSQGGGLSISLSLAAWLGLSLLMAIPFAIFGGSCFYLKKMQWAFPVLAALGWAALEWVHELLATYLIGFPWFSLGYSQWNFLPIIQITSFVGTEGLSALICFTGVSIGYALAVNHFKKGIFQLILAVAVFLGTYGYGYWSLSQPVPRTLLRLRAAVMQPNIDQYKKWSPEFEQEILETISQMSIELSDKKVMLAVWPESVSPGPVQEEPYFSLFKEISVSTGAWQLLGSNRLEGGKNFVSAFLFSPEEENLSFYDKTQLVPFGEYIPFENIIRTLFPKVEILGELGLFSAGKQGQGLLQSSQVPFGTTICYESVFSSKWREQALQGAKFFVNITNDAWFFDTDAPYQHLAISVLRAAELQRPVLRAANTGISAVISSRGEILSSAPLNTRQVLYADIALPLGVEQSFYAQWGKWFAWVCAAIYFTILLSVMVFSYE